jgi:hypothetical protein
VHICVANGEVVLLDLARDKYLAVVPPHRLAGWVKGWPVQAAGTAANEESRDAMLGHLVEAGILVTDLKAGKEAAPVQTKSAATALLKADFGSRPHASAAHLARLGVAYARAWASLKLMKMEAVVQNASRRKARAREATPVVQAIAVVEGQGLIALRELVAAFVHLRPLFYTARKACLLDCLTLLNFLAPHGIFPDWVFGVQADPFYSHCWLQHEGAVLNDHPDFVRRFTPILVV